MPITFLEERFSCLKAGGRAIVIKKTVGIEQVQLLHDALKDFDTAYDSKFW